MEGSPGLNRPSPRIKDGEDPILFQLVRGTGLISDDIPKMTRKREREERGRTFHNLDEYFQPTHKRWRLERNKQKLV